jgi:DNA repair exonuclease SbcCD ATPase subunit
MAVAQELNALVQDFARKLEQLVEQRAREAFAARFDEARAQLVEPTTAAPAPGNRRTVVKTRRSPLAGLKAEPKPCPVCGKKNTARRFAYLCEDHRSDANVQKFKRKK